MNQRSTELQAKYRVICKTLEKGLVKLVLNNIVRGLESTKATDNGGADLPNSAFTSSS
jgi:hypothetical protein